MRTHIEYDDFGAYEETLEDLTVYDGPHGRISGANGEPEIIKTIISILLFNTSLNVLRIIRGRGMV